MYAFKTRLFLGMVLISTGILVTIALRSAPAGAANGNYAAYIPVAPHHAPFLPGIALEPVVDGLDNPTNITHAGDDRLFVALKAGIIHIVDSNGQLQADPFLDITGRVDATGEEQGLLGLAFHPDYATNGYFYVYYTDLETNSTISRFSVRQDNPQLADPDSETVILVIEQPTIYHQAGALAFSPRNGYLYIGSGESAQTHNAQDKSNLLGKVLRIDVDSAVPYAIPLDNPFVDDPDARPEIWAYGLRNPWRISFDRATGDLYIADVGGANREEINVLPADSPGGQNYGWGCWEGTYQVNLSQCDESQAYIFPEHEYPHEGTLCAITGGYVYRGQEYPALSGHYLFTDFCSGQFWSLTHKGAGNWLVKEVYAQMYFWGTTFGEDVHGELYVAGYFGNDTLWKITVPE